MFFTLLWPATPEVHLLRWWWRILLSGSSARAASTAGSTPVTASARATTLAPGAAATAAVAQNGSALTFDFGIPSGEPGATGPQGPAGTDGGFAPVAGETGVYRATASNGTTVDITIAPDGSGSGYTMTAAAAGA